MERMPVSRLALIAWLACHVSIVTGLRVLMVPINVNSHVLDHGRLARALAHEGHVVTVLVASNAHVPEWVASQINVTVLRYDVDERLPFVNTEEFSSAVVRIALTIDWPTKLKLMTEFSPLMLREWDKDCDALLRNEAIRSHVLQTGYDIAVSDTAGIMCQAYFPWSFGIPYVNFGVLGYGWIYRNPDLASFVPNGMSPVVYSDRMSLWERTINTIFYLNVEMLINRTTHYSEKYAPGKPPLNPVELFEKSLLVLTLDDPSTSYPRPFMPNVVPMGDLMAEAAGPLPNELQHFMDLSSDGVILVSFGSFIEHLPGYLTDYFCSAFSQLKQNVVWKSKDSGVCRGGPGIKVLPWLPQNDLLGHPNLKLFITHCGLNSVIEAVNHGVPMLGIPIALDQPLTAVMIEAKGYGLKMSLSEITEDDLLENIHAILNSDTMNTNVEIASKILNDKPQTAGRRASFWINHVIKYGDKHLRTAAFELSPYQFMMLDVYAVLFGIVLALFFSSCCCLKLCCRLLKRTLCRTTKAKAKEE